MVPEKVWEGSLGGLGAEPAQIQQGTGEGPGEGSREGSRKPWCKAKLGPPGFQRMFRRRLEKVPEKAGEALVQSQVKFNRVLEKVPEKVWEALVQGEVKFNRVPEKVWEALVQSQARFITVPEKIPKKVWEALVQSLSSSSGFWEKGLGRLGAEPVPTGFRRRFRRRSGRLWCKGGSGSTKL